MNRPIISATIAAGVLFTGPGLMIVATAAAEPGGSGAGNDAGVVATDGLGTTGRGPRPPYRDQVDPTTEFPYLRPVGPAGPSGNSGIGIIPVPPAPRTPVAVVSGGVDRAVPEIAVPEAPELSELSPPAFQAPEMPVFNVQAAGTLPAQRPILPAAPMIPVPVGPVAPSGGPAPWQPVPGTAPAPLPRPALSPPAAAPSARPPAAAGPVRERGRAGTAGEPLSAGSPNFFPDADIGGAAARALPGLAAILGMTAIGAIVGYRQARAGHMLRAAGAARFLQ